MQVDRRHREEQRRPAEIVAQHAIVRFEPLARRFEERTGQRQWAPLRPRTRRADRSVQPTDAGCRGAFLPVRDGPFELRAAAFRQIRRPAVVRVELGVGAEVRRRGGGEHERRRCGIGDRVMEGQVPRHRAVLMAEDGAVEPALRDVDRSPRPRIGPRAGVGTGERDDLRRRHVGDELGAHRRRRPPRSACAARRMPRRRSGTRRPAGAGRPGRRSTRAVPCSAPALRGGDDGMPTTVVAWARAPTRAGG